MILLTNNGMMTSKKKLFTKVSLTLGAVFILGSCGQDRNLNEYRTSQVELELNKYRSIQGTYRGLAFQKNAKLPLASVEVQLFANTVVDSDGLRREARPVLQSYVTLRVPGLEEIVVSMDSGFFLTQEGIFKTSVVAKRSDVKRTLQLEGQLQSNGFDGTLSVFGYPNTALQIQLTRDQEWPQLEPKQYGKDRFPYIAAREEVRYDGVAHYLTGEKIKASLRLLNNSIDATSTLIDILSPVRIFTGLIDIDKQPPRLTFSAMKWDVDAHRLSGVTHYGGVDNIELRIECTEQMSSRTQTWNCTYTSSLGGTLSDLKFQRSLSPASLSNLIFANK